MENRLLHTRKYFRRLATYPSVQQLTTVIFHISKQTDPGDELKAIFECKLQQYVILFKYTYACIKLSTFTCLAALVPNGKHHLPFYINNIHQNA